jgi:hypothetical protein
MCSLQRAHIPQSIMDVLLGNKRPHLEEFDVGMEAVSISIAVSILCSRTQILRKSSEMLIK